MSSERRYQPREEGHQPTPRYSICHVVFSNHLRELRREFGRALRRLLGLPGPGSVAPAAGTRTRANS
jgi:hypothetical protein